MENNNNIDPPFEESYKKLLFNKQTTTTNNIIKECDLPLIDLNNNHERCVREMSEAASEWGFFQVVNHGIPKKVLEKMRSEEMKMFHQPFCRKSEPEFMELSEGSYRWGNPTATCVRQFSWSEAFHIPLSDVQLLDGSHCNDNITSLSSSSRNKSGIGVFAKKAASLARRIAECLGENVGVKSTYFEENCVGSSSFVRMNRYPACPSSETKEINGLMAHTDSDFLTILYQDHVGGLQLMKDGNWLTVKPNPDVLIVNIGDLFQALSNGRYKSIEHRVVANKKVERFSVAYFYCPSHEAVIESCSHSPIYKKFSFNEYRQQVQLDVRATGDKVGLSRFLLQ